MLLQYVLSFRVSVYICLSNTHFSPSSISISQVPSKLRKDSNRSRSHRISEVSAEPLSASLEGRSASNAQTWNGAGTLQLDQQAWKPRIVQDPVFQHALVYKSSWPGPMDAHGCPRANIGEVQLRDVLLRIQGS